MRRFSGIAIEVDKTTGAKSVCDLMESADIRIVADWALRVHRVEENVTIRVDLVQFDAQGSRHVVGTADVTATIATRAKANTTAREQVYRTILNGLTREV